MNNLLVICTLFTLDDFGGQWCESTNSPEQSGLFGSSGEGRGVVNKGEHRPRRCFTAQRFFNLLRN